MSDQRNRKEKLRAMADQTASPNEAANARAMLGESAALTIKPQFWVLGSDHALIPTDDVQEWGRMFEGKERVVDYTQLDGVNVSTVFLGIDHNYYGGAPLLFETMIFADGSWMDMYCERYSTWAEAEEGHARIVAAIQDGTLNIRESGK